MVHLRPVRLDDEPALHALNAAVSDRSIYLRFFAVNRHAADEHAHHLAALAPEDQRIALVAESHDRLIAVGSLERSGPEEAEVAFLVDDAFHGRGIGTLLLEQLASLARENGIRRLRADTLAENVAMLRVFTDSGFEQVRTTSHGVVELTLSTAYTPTTLDRIAERERDAEHRSLAQVLAPASVAVIGAGRRPGSVGHEVVANLADAAFTGRLFAVNPHATPVAGVPAYTAIGHVPAPVDLAVVAVPAAVVPEVLEECGEAGVRGAVVLTSGLGELGPDGQAVERDVVRRARHHGLRLIGPNCLGVVNTDPAIRLDATFASVHPTPGALALASQSGAVGIAVLDHASRVGLGISQFVSLGNKADVSGNDLLLHWWADPHTEVIGLYLESFGNPRKFGRIARLVGRTKPVLVVKGGRSAGGRRAGASHTAAAATPDTAVDALFTQAGVLRMDTLEELIETARVLSGQPLPRGRRIAIVGNAGGAGVLAADAAEARGLGIRQLSPTVRQALREATGAVAADNPIDLGAAARPQTLERAIRIVADSGEADALVVVFAATRAASVEHTYAAIGRAGAGARIPIVVNCLGCPDADVQVETGDGRRLPVFPFPEAAVRAVNRAVQYATWRERPQGVVPVVEPIDLDGARAAAREFLAVNPDGGWLDPATTDQVARCCGIPFEAGVVVDSVEKALDAATRLHFPLALKTAATGVVHKTDIGGVQLGIATRRHLRQAYRQISTAAADPRVLVQPMVPSGVELVVGLTRDPLFGPVLMAGGGGVLTDLLADRSWRGLPLTDLDAAEMLRSLRCAPALAGYRGAPAADERAVLDVIHRVARLAEAVPEVAELDINPLVATPSGAVAVDLKLRVAPAAAEPDPYARRLR
jgi:acyl-CoA synthetase (NDP forming)/GNAT superfamily N-acetyltransferase